MRLLLVSDLPHPQAVNGISIYLDDLQGTLIARGLTLAVFCQGTGKGGTRLKRVQESGVPRYVMEGSPIRYQNAVADPLPGCTEPKTDAAFRQTLQDFQPQIVHFHEFVRTPASCIMMAKEFRAKVVVSLHDFWLLCPRLSLLTPNETICPGPKGGINCVINCLGGSPASRFYRSLLACNSPWVAPAKGLRDVFKRLRGEPLGQRPGRLFLKHYQNLRLTDLIEKLRIRERFMLDALNSVDLILPVSSRMREIFSRHGVTPELIRPLSLGVPRAAQLTYRLRVPQRPIKFGFLGNLGPGKGNHLIVEAAKNIDPAEALFLLYGGADHYAKADLDRISRHLPHVRYFGAYRRDELQSILDGLDVLILPSLWDEPLGVVALEALASGVPVLGAKIGGITDYLRNGVNGLLFSPGDVHALKESILFLLEKPERIVELSRGARGTAPSMEGHTETLMNLYCGLLR